MTNKEIQRDISNDISECCIKKKCKKLNNNNNNKI